VEMVLDNDKRHIHNDGDHEGMDKNLGDGLV